MNAIKLFPDEMSERSIRIKLLLIAKKERIGFNIMRLFWRTSQGDQNPYHPDHKQEIARLATWDPKGARLPHSRRWTEPPHGTARPHRETTRSPNTCQTRSASSSPRSASSRPSWTFGGRGGKARAVDSSRPTSSATGSSNLSRPRSSEFGNWNKK